MKQNNSHDDRIKDTEKQSQKVAEYKLKKITGYEEDGTVKPKVVWKWDGYMQAIIYRTVELANEAIQDWKNGKTVPAILQGRAVMETVATAYGVIEKLKNHIQEANLELIDKDIMQYSFGSRNMDLEKAIHVQTSIEKVDKWIPGYMDIYNELCEGSHPNYRGTLWAYSDIDKDTYEIIMSETSTDGMEYLDHFMPVALEGSMGIMEMLIKEYMSYRPSLIALASKE